MFDFDEKLNSNFKKQELPDYFEGLKKFQDINFKRPKHNYQLAWSFEQFKCYYISEIQIGKPILLIIPSLINRYYILDLNDDLSLVKYLNNKDYNVLLLDWGQPTEKQKDINAAGYLLQYLLPLIEYISAKYHEKIHLVGYCVGGLLAMACAIIAKDNVKSLTLLATPWDFSKEHYTNNIWIYLQNFVTENWCNNSPLISGEYLSWLFFLTDPESFSKKYSKFAMLEKDSKEYCNFLAVEHWVNDTVTLTSGFARDCLINWSYKNQTFKQEWQVNGEIIIPEKVDCPTLIIAPEQDKIVPLNNAIAIAKMKNVKVLTPQTGHIGMITGRDRAKNLWQPLTDWIEIQSLR